MTWIGHRQSLISPSPMLFSYLNDQVCTSQVGLIENKEKADLTERKIIKMEASYVIGAASKLEQSRYCVCACARVCVCVCVVTVDA